MLHLLSSAYLGPIHYYTKLASGHPILEERCDHYLKQTYRNRCCIATAAGVQTLSIPVCGREKAEGGDSKTPMHEMCLSDHGRWRELHWNALLSAYDRTPYFEYYADDFLQIYRTPFFRLVDFNEALQQLVLRLLDIQPDVTANLEEYWIPDVHPGTIYIDWRDSIHPKKAYTFDPTFYLVPYYQVFSSRHGFIPNLSIVDLLFNMGPESRGVLRKSIRS